MDIYADTFWVCNIPGEDRFRVSGTWSLDYIYDVMQEQDRVRFFFYDDNLHTIEKFKEWARAEHNWFYALYLKGTQEPLAFAVLNNHMGYTAMIHYCLMDEGLPHGKDIVDCFFSEARKTKQCLIGITPKPFRHAWKFSMAVGGKLITELPGACYLARRDSYVPGVVTQFDLRSKDMGGEV